MVESRKYKHRHKSEHDERDDDFLRRLIFRRRAQVHTALQQLAVMDEEIDAVCLGRYLKDGQENPPLPIAKGSRGQKNTCHEKHEKDQIRCNSADVEITHTATSSFSGRGRRTSRF